MITVLAVPGIVGILPGRRDAQCCSSFFGRLHRAMPESDLTCVCLNYAAAELGLLGVFALPFMRRQAERGLDETAPLLGRSTVIVSHSLGTELVRGWLVDTGYQPALWIMAGTYDGLIGGTVRSFTGHVTRPWPDVPALNLYHPDDRWGGPLPGVDSQVLCAAPGASPGHAYWDDAAFARAVGEAVRGRA